MHTAVLANMFVFDLSVEARPDFMQQAGLRVYYLHVDTGTCL